MIDKMTEPAERIPHPKPTLLYQEAKDGIWENEFWVYCPQCLARSDGFRKDGSPRYAGGYLTIRHHEVTEKRPRHAFVFCTCWVGHRKREIQREQGYNILELSQIDPHLYDIVAPLHLHPNPQVSEGRRVIKPGGQIAPRVPPTDVPLNPRGSTTP